MQYNSPLGSHRYSRSAVAVAIATTFVTSLVTSLITSLGTTLTNVTPAIAQPSPQNIPTATTPQNPVLATAETISPTPEVPQDAIAMRMTELKQSRDRWIEIRLGTQRLVAWEGDTPVYAIVISTGKAEAPTLTGTFAIQSKYEVTRMQGATYDVPDVPFAMYYDGHYAIHGAYWHHRFGTPVSHGCVNVAVNHAEWLFNWASVGTPVVVHE